MKEFAGTSAVDLEVVRRLALYSGSLCVLGVG
jgi:hypothetical protein